MVGTISNAYNPLLFIYFSRLCLFSMMSSAIWLFYVFLICFQFLMFIVCFCLCVSYLFTDLSLSIDFPSS